MKEGCRSWEKPYTTKWDLVARRIPLTYRRKPSHRWVNEHFHRHVDGVRAKNICHFGQILMYL